MVLGMNVAMVVFATLSFTFAISYFAREKEMRNIRWYIFLLGMSCGCANLGYVLMSINPISPLTVWVRDLGMAGENLYLFFEYLLVTSQIRMKRSNRITFGVIMGALITILIIIHGRACEVTFIEENGFTTFINNELIGYKIQTINAAFYFVVLFSIACLWLAQQTTKRGKTFVILCFISNFFYIFSSFPYLLGMKTAHPAFLYCLGVFVAFFCIWYAGNVFSGFNVTTQSLGSEIFGDLNAGLIIFDDQGQLIMRNEYAKNELMIHSINNQKVNEIFDITDEEVTAFVDKIKKEAEFQVTCRIKESSRIFSVNFKKKLDRFGDLLCVIGVVNDITKQQEMIQEVIKANNAKSDFLASMSHEIRTPINAVLGMNEMIIRESTEKDIVGYALDVESSGKMLLSLINDILDFSKIESGKMELVPDEYDLSDMFNDIYNMLIGRASDKGLKFNLKVDENLPVKLYGDEIRVRQIIINLMTNAIKYTDKGSVTLEVSSNTADIAKAESIMLVIKVSDTGKGIKPEDIDKLFKSFTRVDETANKSIEGTGLGLSLTKSFVEMMGGQVSVESVYGEGSAFTVVIKQKVIDASPIGNLDEKIKANKVKRSSQQDAFKAEGCQMLLVDDVDMNCKVFCNLLKKSGAVIDVAHSGEEALKLCESKKYDIIFMDHMMPVMDGIECLHLIRAGETINKDSMVVALTANAIAGMKEMYLSEGFDDYVTKPVRINDLENVISKYWNE